jgi:hypothetical protein
MSRMAMSLPPPGGQRIVRACLGRVPRATSRARHVPLPERRMTPRAYPAGTDTAKQRLIILHGTPNPRGSRMRVTPVMRGGVGRAAAPLGLGPLQQAHVPQRARHRQRLEGVAEHAEVARHEITVVAPDDAPSAPARNQRWPVDRFPASALPDPDAALSSACRVACSVNPVARVAPGVHVRWACQDAGRFENWER